MNDQITEPQAQDAAVYAVAASPAYTADGLCFAATGMGLQISEDFAAGFRDAYAGMRLPEALPTPAVALSPRFATDKTVFAGVHGAILRSHDRGATWQVAELRTPPPIVTCLAVSPNYEQDGILFAGTLEDGVFRSADRGGRWVAWNFGLIDLRVLCLGVSPLYGQDETLVVGTETGLFRSTNGGRAWRELGLPTELAPVLSMAISPAYARDNTLFAGTESNGLWRSADRGKSWEPVEALGDSAVNAVLLDAARETLSVAALVGEEIVLSPDGGSSWQSVLVDADWAPICLTAPCGLGVGAPLLIGCADGVVRQVHV